MGNKNNYNNANFVQVGYQYNGCHKDCDNNNDVPAATPYDACNCDNGCDNGSTYSNNGRCCDNDSNYNNNGRCCDNDSTYNNDTACTGNGKRGRGRSRSGDKCCNCDCDCDNADETHIFFETCDGAKEVCVTGRCQEDEALGRTLDVNCTLLNVCPGRRSALGITLTEMDEDGTEYARGFRAITVPAHNARCNQDVDVDTVRFILPEDLSLQERRHFIVRTQHHYLDASSIWNNGWGGKR